jgi:predicted nucleic acid-binding protein
MPIQLGLDTSYVLGLIDEQDLWHARALQLQGALEATDFHVSIFDCVLAEVISVLARRTHEQRRSASFPELAARIQARFPAKSITWLYPDLPTDYEAVLKLVAQANGELNFNDALIAIACRKRNIAWLASFDADFDRVTWLKRVAQPADLPAV